MVNAFIVEDEFQAIGLLKNYIGRIPELNCVGATKDPMQALISIQNEDIDLLFLDINLPGISGVELYKSLKNPPTVIFTTAYSEYAVQGFELEALDYLLKPITFPRFLKAYNRYLDINRKMMSPVEEELISPNDMVFIKSGQTTFRLSWKSILYLEKSENYVIYHTAEKRVLSRQTLSDLELIFPDYFTRIHKSYAISLLHLDQIDYGEVKIGKAKLPIGRTYRNRFLEQLEVFQKKGG